jgi:hypothetical protein
MLRDGLKATATIRRRLPTFVMNRSAAQQRKQKMTDSFPDLGDVSVHLRGCGSSVSY